MLHILYSTVQHSTLVQYAVKVNCLRRQDKEKVFTIGKDFYSKVSVFCIKNTVVRGKSLRNYDHLSSLSCNLREKNCVHCSTGCFFNCKLLYCTYVLNKLVVHMLWRVSSRKLPWHSWQYQPFLTLSFNGQLQRPALPLSRISYFKKYCIHCFPVISFKNTFKTD